MDPQILREAMTAYQAVYDEDLREDLEFKNWVNSLVEEGYNLSEYTCEEMYEAYLEEQGGQRGSRSSASQTNQSVSGSQIKNALGTFAQRTIGSTPIVAGARYVAQQAQRASSVPTSSGPRNVRGGGRTTTNVMAAKPSPAPTQSRFAGARDAVFKKAQAIQGSPVVGPRSSAATSSSAPVSTRPAAPSTAAAKPAPSAPATTLSSLSKQAAKPTAFQEPAIKKPSLSSQAAELRQMRARSLERQGKPLAAAAVSATSKPATFKENNLDTFDVVKGYLIDEGYADTEESALVIMANMSEEWRSEIISELDTETIKSAIKRRQGRIDADIETGRHDDAESGMSKQDRSKRALARKRNPDWRETGLRRGNMNKEAFNIFVNSMISEGISLDRYSWDEIESVFDDLFEAQRARENPEEYESGEGRRTRGNQSREQQLRGRVMDRMSKMDPEKKKKMIAQMRAVGLDV